MSETSTPEFRLFDGEQPSAIIDCSLDAIDQLAEFADYTPGPNELTVEITSPDKVTRIFNLVSVPEMARHTGCKTYALERREPSNGQSAARAIEKLTYQRPINDQGGNPAERHRTATYNYETHKHLNEQEALEALAIDLSTMLEELEKRRDKTLAGRQYGEA